MKKQVSQFSLNGGVEQKSGKWRAEICLSTPDGKETRLDSGFVFTSEKEADENLKFNLDRILADFTQHGVEVVSRNGVSYQ